MEISLSISHTPSTQSNAIMHPKDDCVTAIIRPSTKHTCTDNSQLSQMTAQCGLIADLPAFDSIYG